MIRRGLILVEGQSEERFVKEVLGPHLLLLGLQLTPTLLTTKVVKSGPNFKGGISHFKRFDDDMRRLLHGAGRDGIVTTMLDYYRLPTDFPGMADRPSKSDPVARVSHVEKAISDYYNDRRLIPFLALHEFEAWIFSCSDTLPTVMAQPHLQPQFAAVCNQDAMPEQINERPNQNPASRIAAIFPAFRKTLHGPTALMRIGLPLVRQRCPHFDAWVTLLESQAGPAI